MASLVRGAVRPRLTVYIRTSELSSSGGSPYAEPYGRGTSCCELYAGGSAHGSSSEGSARRAVSERVFLRRHVTVSGPLSISGRVFLRQVMIVFGSLSISGGSSRGGT